MFHLKQNNCKDNRKKNNVAGTIPPNTCSIDVSSQLFSVRRKWWPPQRVLIHVRQRAVYPRTRFEDTHRGRTGLWSAVGPSWGEVFRTLTHNVTLETFRQNSVVPHHGEKKQAAAEEPACRQRQRCKTFIYVAATLANRVVRCRCQPHERASISEMPSKANQHVVYISLSVCSLQRRFVGKVIKLPTMIVMCRS